MQKLTSNAIKAITQVIIVLTFNSLIFIILQLLITKFIGSMSKRTLTITKNNYIVPETATA